MRNFGASILTPKNSVMYDKQFQDQVSAQRAASAQAQIAPMINVNTAKSTVVAGVNRAPISKVSLGSLIPITLVFTPGTAAKTFAIGNPFSIVSGANGITVNGTYAAGSSWTYEQLQGFAINGFVISTVNYEVTNAAQFSQAFRYASADIGKSSGVKELQGLLTSASRSTDQNLLIKTLDLSSFNGELSVTSNNSLFLTVAAGYTATLTLTISAVLE
jgi:hypothetical protein